MSIVIFHFARKLRFRERITEIAEWFGQESTNIWVGAKIRHSLPCYFLYFLKCLVALEANPYFGKMDQKRNLPHNGHEGRTRHEVRDAGAAPGPESGGCLRRETNG